MVEKLGEIGRVLTSIAEAEKALNLMQQKNEQLCSIIDETRKQAMELEKLQIPGEPLLHELKRPVREMRDLGFQLRRCIRNFHHKADSFNNSVKTKLRGNCIPSEVIVEFCTDLNAIYTVVKDFSNALDKFTSQLSKAQQLFEIILRRGLATKLNQKQQQVESQAESTESRGAAWTAGLALAAAGSVALGFFTGGAAWVAAGAVAGAGAAVVGAVTRGNVRKMRELASAIGDYASNLGVIAKNLRSSSIKAGDIRLDRGIFKFLETALAFFRRALARDSALAEKDAKIAELKLRLRIRKGLI